MCQNTCQRCLRRVVQDIIQLIRCISGAKLAQPVKQLCQHSIFKACFLYLRTAFVTQLRLLQKQSQKQFFRLLTDTGAFFLRNHRRLPSLLSAASACCLAVFFRNQAFINSQPLCQPSDMLRRFNFILTF